MVAKQRLALSSSQAERLQALQQQLQNWQHRPADGAGRVSSGCSALDNLLPAGGFLRGTLVEWLSAGAGSGAALLALIAACQACQAGGMLVVVDRQGWFYPPAIAGWKFAWRQLVVVRPETAREQLWVVDQALRCPAVAAVWTELEELGGKDFRRLQLAAEQGGTLGMLLRPLRQQGEPSWSDLQLLIRPEPGRGPWVLHVVRLRGRGPARRDAVVVELDEAQGRIRPGRGLPEEPPRSVRAEGG